jgi:hypothetical protein
VVCGYAGVSHVQRPPTVGGRAHFAATCACTPGEACSREGRTQARAAGGDMVVFVQMSFGGHVHKEASDQLQKKLQEAMGDDADKLAAGLAGMDMNDNMSIASDDTAKIVADIESIASSAAAMALEEARAEVKRLKTEMYVMKVQEQAKSKNMRQLTQKEIFHNNITGSPVVAGAVRTMENMDACTLWWVVQWGNEYLARFKHSATGDAIDELEAYKTWTQKQKAKVAAGFTHTTTAPRSAGLRLALRLALRRRLLPSSLIRISV